MRINYCNLSGASGDMASAGDKSEKGTNLKNGGTNHASHVGFADGIRYNENYTITNLCPLRIM
jgi:hypothetical protein